MRAAVMRDSHGQLISHAQRRAGGTATHAERPRAGDWHASDGTKSLTWQVHRNGSDTLGSCDQLWSLTHL
jgi:hypothetical protein